MKYLLYNMLTARSVNQSISVLSEFEEVDSHACRHRIERARQRHHLIVAWVAEEQLSEDVEEYMMTIDAPVLSALRVPLEAQRMFGEVECCVLCWIVAGCPSH